MSRKKRRNKIDINKRKTIKDYKSKKIEESERFKKNILKKESKLKNKYNEYTDDICEQVSKKRKNKKSAITQSTQDNPDNLKVEEVEAKDPAMEENQAEKEHLIIDKVGNKSLDRKKIKNNVIKDKTEGKRTTDDVKARNISVEKDTVKPFDFQDLSDKQKKKYIKRENKLINKKKRASKLYNKSKYAKSSHVAGAISGTGFIAAEYISAGADENVAIAASDKGLVTGSIVSRKLKNHLRSKRRDSKKTEEKLRHKHNKNMAKAEYKSSLEELKKDKEYQKKSAYKKYINKKRMKKKIYSQHNIKTGIKDRIKKESKEILKSSAQIIIRNFKKIIVILGLIVAAFLIIMQIVTMFVGGIAGVTGNVLGTTYLAEEETLSNVNDEFSSYEYALQNEIDSIESNNPGYDEYILHMDCNLSHDIHTLLSYVTVKYGDIDNASDISDHLAKLFNEMYTVTYKEVVETKYRKHWYGHGDDRDYEIEEYEWYKLVTTVKKKDLDIIVKEKLTDDERVHYEALIESKGNMEDIFGAGGEDDYSEVVNNPDFGNPGIEFNDKEAKKLFGEAEKHIGKKYKFGANGPKNFDCSSFVCWSFTHSGIKNMPRTSAYMIYKNYCNPVKAKDAKPGDIIFFKGTYKTSNPITHVGIYAGDGMMIHAGNPIKYSSINTKYWKQHFYGFGRPK